MPPQGSLISLSGLDGAGKSTIAHQLGQVLTSDYGIPSRYVWCKFGIHPLSRYHLSTSIGQGQVGRSHSIYDKTIQPSIAVGLYGLALLTFHLAQIFFAVRRPVRRGQAVICDRYIFDTMVDLQQDMNFPKARVRTVFSPRWIPRPDCRVLLDLEEEVAFGRKVDTTSVEYLRQRRGMYLDIAREYGLTIVDASQSVDAITQFLIRQIDPGRFRGTSIK